jgi:hypothetical protein
MKSLRAAMVIAVLLYAQVTAQAADKPTIRLSQKTKDDLEAAFEVVGLDRAVLAKLARADFKPAQWTALFAVYVYRGPKDEGKPPPFLGSHRVKGNVLRFEPRFPLVRGVRYRAVFDPSRVPGQEKSRQAPIVADFLIPKLSAAPTVVENVFPTADKLPENQLKFYVHFSAPMSQGDVYKHVHLLDAAGKPIRLPFLELQKELWDADGRRFTLFFDPGRIKRGLKPREELGPVLEEGKTYTLVIDRDWLDAEGNPVKDSYRKKFKVGASEREAPNPKTWKIQAPRSGTAGALTVIFPRPMDHALLVRSLSVIDAQDRRIAGTVLVSHAETRWHFTPRQPWAAGKFYLLAETNLEDLAGNNLDRPFEVDVFHPIERRLKVKTIRIPFQAEQAK